MVNYDVTDDVIMTSFNRVRLYSYNINPTKFGEDRMKNGQVIVLTSSRADFNGNDVIVTSLMTSSLQKSIGFFLTHQGTIL